MKRMSREEKIALVAKKREEMNAKRAEEQKKAAEETRERVRLVNEAAARERLAVEAELKRRRDEAEAKELEERQRLIKIEEIKLKAQFLKAREDYIKAKELEASEAKKLIAKEKEEALAKAEAALAEREQKSRILRSHRNWSKVPKEFQDKVTLKELDDLNSLISLQRVVRQQSRHPSDASLPEDQKSSPELQAPSEVQKA